MSDFFHLMITIGKYTLTLVSASAVYALLQYKLKAIANPLSNLEKIQKNQKSQIQKSKKLYNFGFMKLLWAQKDYLYCEDV